MPSSATKNWRRKELLVQEAFKRAGVAKKNCVVEWDWGGAADIYLFENMSEMRMRELRDLFYFVSIMIKSETRIYLVDDEDRISSRAKTKVRLFKDCYCNIATIYPSS